MVLLVAKSGVVGPCRGIFALGGRAPCSLSEGERGIFRRYCGADAGGEVDPIPGDGGASPSEGECLFGRLRRRGFRTLRRAGGIAAFGGGRVAAGRQPGKCTLRRAGTRPSRGEGQKGVQDTCGFLYPLLRLPLIFRWLLSAASQLKTRAAIKTALSSGALRRRLGLASRVFPRISVRGSGFWSGGLETVCIICPDCSRRAG